MSEIIATPLDLPMIEPDDWDIFWKLWNEKAEKLVKVKNYTSSSKSPLGQNNMWLGMELYKNSITGSGWAAPQIDIKDLLPNFYNSIIKSEIKSIVRVTLVQSLQSFIPHKDSDTDLWVFRANIHFPSPTPQFYFTKAGADITNKKYMVLPKETNWFSYNDSKCWHGSDFDPEHPKILLQVFTKFDTRNLDLVNRSIEKYKDYTIEL